MRALTYQLVVEINHRRKELADLKVRQAIAHAIDKDFVVKTIFLGYAKPLDRPGAAERAGSSTTPTSPTYAFDVAKANALLDEAGYPTRRRRQPLHAEAAAGALFQRDASSSATICARRWPQSASTPRLVNNDAAAHQKAVYTDHDFDLAVAPPVFRGDPAISTTILFQSGMPDGVPFSNQGGYANAELDALIAKAAETIDAAARTELYKEFQKLVAEDLPLINVAEWGFITVARTSVKNVSNNPRWAVSNWADTALES